ncbi:MAG TPA: DinB family protein [Gemmatimonadales bacterium]|jgi:uncharacterized damage-inducible protein DinB|nr:DinB family protein [Gemmatimonadales bacterium]
MPTLRAAVPLILLTALSRGSVAQTAPATQPNAVATLRELWMIQSNYVLQTAEAVPESLYSFRPVKSVRSFGELFGHVAGSQNNMCGVALGEPERNEDEVEKSRSSKADLVAALRASNTFCERAYAQTDRAVEGKATLFGRERTRLAILGLNATHDAEHYGNLVTYLRINGMVPPSSRPPQ